MAYRGGHYDFVIDSSFQPFTMQEMLTPLALYKEAFEKSEEAYADLKTKADVFKELSASLPEDSKARQIYEGYANDLNTQAEDLARNGLNMGNRRALTSLKQRYSGEIGRLDRAKTALEEAKKMRSALEASGKRRLYATNNFTIDDFLDGNTPNMYSVDPDVLYAKGAQRGKAVSSRMTDIKEGGNMIDGYFRNIIQSTGMDPQKLNRWMQSDEFSKMVDLAMLEEGVAGNLKGMDYLRAKQAYVSGIFDGVVYTESHNPQRNPGVLDPKERHSIAMDNARFALSQQEMALKLREYADQKEKDELSLWSEGITKDANGNWVYNPENSIAVRKAAAVKAASSGKSGSSGSESNTTHTIQGKEKIRLQWRGNNPNDENGDADDDMAPPQILPNDTEEYAGKPADYEDLPAFVRKKVDKIIGRKNGGDPKNYQYYYKPFEHGFLHIGNDTETVVDIVPMELKVDNAPFDFSNSGWDTNMLPEQK